MIHFPGVRSGPVYVPAVGLSSSVYHLMFESVLILVQSDNADLHVHNFIFSSDVLCRGTGEEIHLEPYQVGHMICNTPGLGVNINRRYDLFSGR